MINKVLYAACIGLALSLAGCVKEDDTKKAADEQSVKQTEDNNFMKGESDQANTDVQDALENFSTIGGRVDADKVVCGCTIDSVAPKYIRLTYDGVTPCNTNPRRRRAGVIEARLVAGNHWHNQGAKLELTFKEYKVTRETDDRSITLNGKKYITNERGSNWLGILAQTDSLVLRERADTIKVKYDNGANGLYSMARVTSWKYRTSPIRFIFRAQGDGQDGLDSWGTGRFGNTYTSTFTRPWVSNTYCGVAFPNAGQVVAKSAGNTLTITLGVDRDGNSDTRDCAYGWKLDWLNTNGGTGSAVISY